MRAARVLIPLLVLATPVLAQDDDADDADVAEEGEAEETKTVDPDVKAKLDEVLAVKAVVRPGNVVNVTYPGLEHAELEDFTNKGLEICEQGKVIGGGGTEGTGLELGAGSRGAATLTHDLTFLGTSPMTIEFEAWLPFAAPSSALCLVLSKKVGVAWGQTLVKPTNFKPYTPSQPDITLFREERRVQVKVTWKDQKLTVHCNGRKTDEKEFSKGELDEIRLGFLAKNVRVVVSNLRIEGVVDTKKLSRLKSRE